MTALNQYDRLEATGVWREMPTARRRDVIVSFGDATLTISDPRSEIPLAHWSLPAVTRTNPGQMPARYSPGGTDSDEELEIDDELLVSAMEKVHRVIESRRPHPGRLRGGMTLMAAFVMFLAAFFWLPPAMTRHAVQISPPAQQETIGRIILREIERTTGPACTRPSADPVLARMATRLLGAGHRIVILPATLNGAIRLPGPITIIGNDLIAAQQSPEVAAGHILAAQASASQSNPLLAALQFVGPRAVFHLLTSGEMTPQTLDGYGARLLTRTGPKPDDETLLALFTQAGISSEPYARSLDPTGEATLGLIEADPFRTDPPVPVMDDRSWITLQQICAE